MPSKASKSFWERVNKFGPFMPRMKTRCWIWTGSKHRDGYGQLFFRDKWWKAHRLSWFMKKKRRTVLHVLHKCDNPSCVRPGHLFKGTHTDNVRDMWKKNRGRPVHREACKQAKLTEARVKRIRRSYARGDTSYRKLGKLFRMSHSQIASVVRGEDWKHV